MRLNLAFRNVGAQYYFTSYTNASLTFSSPIIIEAFPVAGHTTRGRVDEPGGLQSSPEGGAAQEARASESAAAARTEGLRVDFNFGKIRTVGRC